MSRELVNQICAAQPGAERSDPWGGGHDCWKIGGKMFAVIGTAGTHVAVKTDSPDLALFLIETGIAERAAYLHRSWVSLALDANPEEIAHRVRGSYQLVRGALPRKLQAGLPPP